MTTQNIESVDGPEVCRRYRHWRAPHTRSIRTPMVALGTELGGGPPRTRSPAPPVTTQNIEPVDGPEVCRRYRHWRAPHTRSIRTPMVALGTELGG
ncbi:TPA: hypothetical protein I8273_004627, partial [Aeromonas hydrophila]|nr:hypothetical protein [Aeromonas hydrophila]HAT3424253.1 hypothetical protein [Aeromonas hydrophila]HAT3534251.1 hypothetical protein [Aeromonas hydrophila]